MIKDGTITAMITPFAGEQVDQEGLRKNIAHQMDCRVDGILFLGTTGEASTLLPKEQELIVSIGVEEAQGKVPVWVGTGSYCTKQTIEKTKKAKDLGADCALIVTPYYNKPTQEGIFRHYEAITKAVDFPIVVYNIPGRCGINIETSTLLQIAKLPNIVGLKEASGNVSQAADVLCAIDYHGLNLKIFSGDDALTLPMMALGGVGVISVLSNLVPDKIVNLVSAARKGDFLNARKLHCELLPLCKALFIETNPVPIKTAMNLCGLPAGDCRLPLYAMEPENIAYLQQELNRLQMAFALKL